ncbi:MULTISPECIES: hypothetical protein [Actinomycetes]|uniref:Uncharacterized protein n=2 Tax=Actinomycetes TaxID=1760 RepID=A0ABN3KU85_9ACTN|nr:MULTISPECIES: hypothetical protein [Streptomyces]MYR04276.1 hypothetical protein [Streptomyces sp. SID6139]MYR20576.1 hypothetical protein [Streptomyces sp. SID6137]MCE3034527.1 hypothetical protein [Streptomyces sp. CMSTAAHL-2]TGZ13274.1 hypothetical protein DV517_73580 [Streptomyces sp. S816]WDO06360.1 hypothetical protein ME763_12110 [Streptomyces murinus]
MAQDPTEPDTIEELDEETAPELGVEEPEVDAVEQQADVRPERDDTLTAEKKDRANEADLLEQARVVSLDEDDYR